MESMKNQDNSSLKTKEYLAQSFHELTPEYIEESPFEELEDTLIKEGYELGDNNSISEILHNNSLLCRSENFTKVIDLISNNETINLQPENGDANMCRMSSSQGYRIAMTEGFSGHDVGNKVKVVISVQSTHISQDEIPRDSDLWENKPKTAEVSISGKGQIFSKDIEMVSFRFPINYFPESMLSETEKISLEEQEIKFIVRHYIKEKNVH
jgi:hypothetical protein